MTQMLDTIEFGRIRIADRKEINSKFDTFLCFDLICEWSFWQLADKYGEIVAVYEEED